jgi:hypothetical protein
MEKLIKKRRPMRHIISPFAAGLSDHPDVHLQSNCVRKRMSKAAQDKDSSG